MTVNSKRTSITSSVLALLLRAKLSRWLWSQAEGVATLSGGRERGWGESGMGVVECCIFICNTFPVSAVGGVIGRAEFHNVVFHRR